MESSKPTETDQGPRIPAGRHSQQSGQGSGWWRGPGGEGTASGPEVSPRGRLDSAAFSKSLEACEEAGTGKCSRCTKDTGRSRRWRCIWDHD